MKDSPEPSTPPLRTFKGEAGTANVRPVVGPGGKPRSGVWFEGSFIGDYATEGEADAVAGRAAEHGLGAPRGEPEEPSSGTGFGPR